MQDKFVLIRIEKCTGIPLNLPEEYPVLFGSFVGGHSNNEKDHGSNVNWIAKETWDFFMRF